MGGVISVDAGADAGGFRFIHCGLTFCMTLTEYCCVPDGNEAPHCVTGSPTSTCPDSAAKVHCDDHTDCPLATQVCCAQTGLMGMGPTATCRPSVNCNGAGRTEILCDPQDPQSCGPGGGTNVCRTDNQTVISGYPSCH
jgi:hypothetical protein